MVLDKGLDPLSMAGYWVAQLVGAALGWGLYKLVTSGDTE